MEDPHLIQLALERGFIAQAQVDKAKHEQHHLAERGIERSLWFLIQDLGYVSDQQSRELRRSISSSRMRALEVDGYVIQGRLGSGGMGDVFRGRNAQGDEVAVKLLSTKYSTHEEYAQRFQREAKATLRLKHPHITKSISAGLMEGQRYLMMELVPGKSMKERINSGGPMPEREALALLAQMALALRYAWRRGVLHRDVKPANIILAPPRVGMDEPFCAKICDFGLAKTWQVAGEETGTMTRGELTHSGVALGTPHYMSPEQASGQHDLDQRTDIYGLGSSLFHALLGQTMYTGKSSAAIMYKQVTEALDLTPLVALSLKPGFVRLMEGMLAKDRARRYRDWDAVLDEIAAIDPVLYEGINRGAPTLRTSSEVDLDPISISGELKGPPAAPVTANRKPIMIVAAVALVVIAALVGTIIVLAKSSGGASVTPDTLAAALLLESPADSTRRLVLLPGDYEGPFTFGVAQSRLTLAAGGPGVRFVAASGDGPLLRFQTGLSQFTLEGVTLQPGERSAMEAVSGAQVSLRDVRIEQTCPRILVVLGADVSVSGLSGRSSGPAIVVANQGRLQIFDSAWASAENCLTTRQSTVMIERSRLSALGEGREAVIDAEGGQLTLTACIVEAQGRELAIRSTRVSNIALRDVAVRGARVGWRSDACLVPTLERVTIEAIDTGIEWIGVRDPQWQWQGLLARSPRPSLGLPSADIGGTGADPGALAAIPVPTTRSP